MIIVQLHCISGPSTMSSFSSYSPRLAHQRGHRPWDDCHPTNSLNERACGMGLCLPRVLGPSWFLVWNPVSKLSHDVLRRPKRPLPNGRPTHHRNGPTLQGLARNTTGRGKAPSMRDHRGRHRAASRKYDPQLND